MTSAEIRAAVEVRLRPLREEFYASGFELLERLLPKEVIQMPVAEGAETVCALECA